MNLGGITQFVGPALVLLLPVGLALWFRRKALAAPVEARASVWFSSFRFLRYLNLATIALWWVSTDFVGLKSRAWFTWLENAPQWLPASRAIFLLCFWILPILVLICCQVLFHPVYVRVREVHWTRTDLARQTTFALGASLVPTLCAIAGIVELTGGGSFRDFALSYALAAFFGISSARALRKHLQLTPNALTTGELRDRAFVLAGRLGVKLRQIYLLPPGKSRLANAFARSGNSILLTEVLLADLTRREVDSVIGHELSHLKQDHPRLLGFALMGGLAAVIVPYFFFQPSRTWQPLFDLFFIVVPLLSFYFVSRRFEYAADQGSIKLTGDPAAMITALVKLHHLNLMPLEWSKWSEKGMTHPSTVRRARAIGRAAEMSEERVRELLATPFSPTPGLPEAHYEIPHTSASPKIFSSQLKQRIAVRAFLLFSGLAILLPSLLLRTLGDLAWPREGWLAVMIALISCLAVVLIFANFAAFLGYRQLCRRLRDKLKAESVPTEQTPGWLVGLAPGNTPRIFESNYSWDIGFLLLTTDRLCYWGEETHFSLRRDQILSIEPGPGFPDWFRTRFLYIRWQASPGQPETTFNIRPAEVNSILEMCHAFRALHERISSWYSAPAPLETDETDSNGFASRSLPPTAQVTSTAPSAQRDPRQIVGLLTFTGVVSALSALLLNLRIEWPVEWLVPTDLAQSTACHAGISGWYAILISLLMMVLRFAPTWFFRSSGSPAPIPVPPPPIPVTKPDPSNVP